MSSRHLSIILDSLFILFIILFTLSFFFDVPRAYIEQQLEGSEIAVSVVYISVVILTTVFAPLVGLPLTPVVSVIIGPFLTALYSVLGWTVGAVIVFFIARYLARPFLSRLINMSRIEKYERYIPEKHIFLWLVFLRMIVPVDILSYVIGFTKRIKFPVYVLSTFIGIIPFSFIWAYGGYSLIEKDYIMFSIFSGIGILLFFVSLVYYYLSQRSS